MVSINSRRHSLCNLTRDHVFTLSPAVEGMEPMLLAIGSVSGCDQSKCATLCVPLVGVGKSSDEREADSFPSADIDASSEICCQCNTTTTFASCDADLLAGAPKTHKKARRKLCSHPRLRAVDGAAAHLVCHVTQVLHRPSGDGCRCTSASSTSHAASVGGSNSSILGHAILLCRIEAASVIPSYWSQGKLFAAGPPSVNTSASSTREPTRRALLGFAGSKTFVAMRLLHSDAFSSSSAAERRPVTENEPEAAPLLSVPSSL